MLSIKGKFRAGVAQPLEPISGREGQEVIITFLDDVKSAIYGDQADWNHLTKLVAECAMETGIDDLADEHDHYLYGKPKRNEAS
jgi:hypothetical protein